MQLSVFTSWLVIDRNTSVARNSPSCEVGATSAGSYFLLKLNCQHTDKKVPHLYPDKSTTKFSEINWRQSSRWENIELQKISSPEEVCSPEMYLRSWQQKSLPESFTHSNKQEHFQNSAQYGLDNVLRVARPRPPLAAWWESLGTVKKSGNSK